MGPREQRAPESVTRELPRLQSSGTSSLYHKSTEDLRLPELYIPVSYSQRQLLVEYRGTSPSRPCASRAWCPVPVFARSVLCVSPGTLPPFKTLRDCCKLLKAQRPKGWSVSIAPGCIEHTICWTSCQPRRRSELFSLPRLYKKRVRFALGGEVLQYQSACS